MGPPEGLYHMNDFDTTYDWYVAYDKLGDGCTIDFPVRLKSKISWSPTVLNADGAVKSRIFVTLVKT